MDALLGDHLCNCRCLIDLRNKPFGAVFPVEVQNRIVWMQWVLEHRYRYQTVMKELRALPVSVIADWVSRPNSTQRFRASHSGGWCWACNTHNCDLHNAACRWCSLYETEHTSIELKQYELELQDRRDAISNYNTNAYDQFVREHIQRYFDLHQFTLTHVLIPMLGYVEDGHVQRDRQRLRDNETTYKHFNQLLSSFGANYATQPKTGDA